MNLIRAVGNISDSVLSNFQRAMENHQYAKGESSTISTEQATEYITEALRLHCIKLREESLALAQKKAADEFRRTSEIRSSKPRVTLAMGRQSGKTEAMLDLYQDKLAMNTSVPILMMPKHTQVGKSDAPRNMSAHLGDDTTPSETEPPN